MTEAAKVAGVSRWQAQQYEEVKKKDPELAEKVKRNEVSLR
jgi:hypothetical protein